MDARHEREDTLSAWRQLGPHLSPEAVVLFDDIRWAPGMWEAWQMMKEEPGLAWTLDLGRFGLVHRGDAPTRHYDFSVFTGWLRVQNHHRARRLPNR